MEQCSIKDVRLLAGGEDGILQHLPLNDPLDDGSENDQSKTPWDVILNFLTSKPLETTAKVNFKVKFYNELKFEQLLN